MSPLKTINRSLRCRRHRRGVTSVEMALVLPIFFATIFTFIEISRLAFAFNTTQVALIRSTRFLSLQSSVAQDGEDAALDYLRRLGFSEDDVEVTITPAVVLPSTQEVTVNIRLDVQPLPYVIDRSLTRSRE